MPVSNPDCAGLDSSLLVSQLATPMASSAAPAMRPTKSASAAGCFSPSGRSNTPAGRTRRPRPVPASTNAVTRKSNVRSFAADLFSEVPSSRTRIWPIAPTAPHQTKASARLGKARSRDPLVVHCKASRHIAASASYYFAPTDRRPPRAGDWTDFKKQLSTPRGVRPVTRHRRVDTFRQRVLLYGIVPKPLLAFGPMNGPPTPQNRERWDRLRTRQSIAGAEVCLEIVGLN